MKNAVLLSATLLLSLLPVTGKDQVSRGFDPLSDLPALSAKAATDKKMVVLVVKGSNDACPRCAVAMDNGLKAVGSGVVKVFARAENIKASDSSAFPAPLKERIAKGFTTGAYVTFVVFDPEMKKIVAEAGREELEADRKAISDFKKEIAEAKKGLK